MTEEISSRDGQIDKLQSQVERLRSRLSKLQIENEKLLNEKSSLTLSRYKSKSNRPKRGFRSSVSPARSLRNSSTERKCLRNSSTERKSSSFHVRSRRSSKSKRTNFSYRSRSRSLRKSKAASDAGSNRSTSSLHRGSTSSLHRGRSPRPRFDPTAWVKAQRERSNSRSKLHSWGKPPSKRRTRSASPYVRRSSSVELSPRSEAIQRPWRNKLRNSAPANSTIKTEKQRRKILSERSPNRRKKLNADEQIENIDSRLSALQSFLEAAKANGEY